MSTSDTDLVRRALAGSNRAWTELVRRHEKRVYNFAFRMTGHRDDAFDLMQEVFVAVHRNLPGFRGDAQFTTWLLRIATYRCTDYLRRRRPLEAIDDYDIESRDATPLEDAEVTGTNAVLVEALKTLPETQKIVLELKFFQQMTFEEIAGHLRISSNTAKTRMYAGLLKLGERPELMELRDAL